MTWEIHSYRKWYTDKTTISELFLNGTKICFILEDVCRDKNRDGDLKDEGEAKVHSKTCIPAGRYQVIVDRSTRFKKDLPLLVGVPGFAGIRIHPGNYDVDTDGCLLPGSTRLKDFVGHSKDTFELFFIRLKALLAKGKVFITIHDLPL